MAAHGRQPWRYFADGWNGFDFLIIVVCLLPVGGPFAAVLRLARALRLLRLVSALPKLQLQVGALLKSLSAMGYMSLLLALLFCLYAVAGIQFFGTTDPALFVTFIGFGTMVVLNLFIGIILNGIDEAQVRQKLQVDAALARLDAVGRERNLLQIVLADLPDKPQSTRRP